jgi:PAS domain S-box-containing protein
MNQPLIEVGQGMVKDVASFRAGREAARQAVSSVRAYAISVVLVFVSTEYNLGEALEGIHSVVGEAPVFGATTAGEICGTIERGTVSVVVLASPYLQAHCGVGERVGKDWRRALDAAIDAPEVRPFFYDSIYKERIRRNGRDCFGMLLVPGIIEGCEYYGFQILEALKEKSNGDFPVFGGGATDYRLERNQVLLGRRVYPDSLLLVVFETELQFGISLTHGFEPGNQRTVVSDVEGNEVLTLDGVVAVEAYSRLVGLPKEKITGSHPAHIDNATLGISDPMGQHTVNLVDSVSPRGGLRLSRPVAVGTVLTRMNATREGLAKAGADGIHRAVIRGEITDIALGLVCYCSFRPCFLGAFVEQDFSGMREALSGRPLVGFCCCGEIGVAADGVSRFNTSSVACLVLGGALSRVARVTVEYNELLAKLERQSDILSRINGDLRKEIDERKKSEAALRASEMKLKDFAQAVPDISMIVDEDGGYIEVFDGGYKLLNRLKEELYGCTLIQRFMPKDAATILRQIRQTIESGTTHCLTYELEVGGEKRFFEGRTAPMSYMVNGKRTVAAVVIDVTEMRKAERMLEFAYEMRGKSDFLNDIIIGKNKVDERVIDIAKTFGIDFNVPLFCCLLSVTRLDAPLAETSDDTVVIQMTNNIIELLNRDSSYIVWDGREGIGVIYQTKSNDDGWEKSRQVARELQEKISSYDSGLVVKIGVSNLHVGTESISSAYQQAWSALIAMRCQSHEEQMINYFRDIGILQLLTNADGKKAVRDFIDDKLKKLIDYDRKKGTEFLLTLEEILQCDNLKEAAKRRYIHYKTMAFRKRRIEKILGVSLDDFETKLALATAVKLNKLAEPMSLWD